MSTVRYVEVTRVTDSSGYFTFEFPGGVDKVMATPNEPQVGYEHGIIAAAAIVTGPQEVKVRCWEATPTGVRTCQNKQVTVTLQGILG